MKRRTRQTLGTAAAAAFGGACIVGAATPAPAEAHPTQCAITSYYGDAARTHQVGMRSTCPGASAWGRTTGHDERRVMSLAVPAPR